VARGCHRLIRDGARLVESAQDVLEELRFATLQAVASPQTPSEPGSRADGTLLEAIGYDPVDLDTLARRTGLAPGLLSARLLELELTQDIERLAGNAYQRLRRK
jgi:DNA processing protein